MSVYEVPLSALAATLPPAATFSEQQKQYLQGFFLGAMQKAPFVAHLPDGRITNDSPDAACNVVAAGAAEPTFWGTPVSDLCAEELWKYQRNPLDCWDDLLAHATENKAPDVEFRYRFKYFG